MTAISCLLRLNSGTVHRSHVWQASLALLFCMLALPSPAVAQTPEGEPGDGNPMAGMLIDTGDDDPIYAVVAFDNTNTNAIDLLREADLDVVTVEFGGLGEAVCEIVETGCDVSACRRRVCQTGDPESPFWQVWQQDEGGQWSASVLGASHMTIDNGDIIAWSWTGVDPELEPLAWSDLANKAGAPDDIINGEPADRLGVWKSPQSSASNNDETPSVTNLLLSSSVLVLIAGVGVVLARRRRNQQPQPS